MDFSRQRFHFDMSMIDTSCMVIPCHLGRYTSPKTHTCMHHVVYENYGLMRFLLNSRKHYSFLETNFRRKKKMIPLSGKAKPGGWVWLDFIKCLHGLPTMSVYCWMLPSFYIFFGSWKWLDGRKICTIDYKVLQQQFGSIKKT